MEGEFTTQTVSGAADPAEVCHRLSQQHKAYGEDKRRFLRKPWGVQIAILLHEESRQREVAVSTQDLSQGGMSFVYEQFLYPGRTVRVRVDSLPDRPALVGVISSCVHVGGMLHRIGVQFTGRESRQGEPTDA